MYSSIFNTIVFSIYNQRKLYIRSAFRKTGYIPKTPEYFFQIDKTPLASRRFQSGPLSWRPSYRRISLRPSLLRYSFGGSPFAIYIRPRPPSQFIIPSYRTLSGICFPALISFPATFKWTLVIVASFMLGALLNSAIFSIHNAFSSLWWIEERFSY